MQEMRKNAKDIAELLKVLANENRLLILCELSKGSASVSELTEKLNITQSGISQHLSMMKAHKILEHNKNGLTVYYSIKDENILRLMEVLREYYCK